MFVNRSLIPHHHQQDWIDLTNHLINNNLVHLDDHVMPRTSRRMGDEWRLLGSKLHHKVDWNDPKKFEVKLNVTNFTPEEITIKVKGNNLLVEAKHEEKRDEKHGKQGYVSRQFTRRYILPDDVDLEQLSSSMDAQGKTLTIHALKKKLQLDGSERVIPITVGEKKQLKKLEVDLKQLSSLFNKMEKKVTIHALKKENPTG